MCGLIKRQELEDVDIGYAYLPAFWSKGYAVEAGAAVMKYGREVLGLKRIVAITSLDNGSSGRVLEKIGLKFEKQIRLPGHDAESRLFTPDE
jgi:RimJ/RimL family protein N-acetyltransferase